MSSKYKLIMPTPEEDAEINRSIAADADTYELDAEEFKQLKVRGGRPRLDTTKVAVTIRYDKSVIDAFKVDGPGWQTRMNDALRKLVERRHV